MPLQEPSASSCVVPAYALRMLLGKPLCVEGVEQRLHGRRLPREDEIGRELGQRLERKAPLREAWMRHGQARLVQYDLTVDEQVEVDRPRPPPLAGAIATERLLYREENIEQRPWLEAGLELDDTVQVPRLLDLPPRSVSRSRETAATSMPGSAPSRSIARPIVASLSPRFAPTPTYARTTATVATRRDGGL